jgi:GNAT superfamily N-acetyltransferase
MFAIRKATRADVDACWEIRRASVMSECSRLYPVDQLEEWTGGVASRAFASAVEECFLVATVDGLVVASGMISLVTGKIDAIFVHPDFMKRGIGAAMIGHLEELACSERLPALTLDSTLNAAPFYRALGFVGEAVTQHASPRGLKLDCVPMVKDLRSHLG